MDVFHLTAFHKLYSLKPSNMIDFKLIAICTLPVRNKECLKILKPGVFYYFLNGYEISSKAIKYTPIIAADFFTKTDAHLKINLSAIVGRNGSGKSSLVELLIRAVNNLSHRLNINTDVVIRPVSNVKLELYFQSDYYYKVALNDRVTIFRQHLNSGSFTSVPLKNFKLSSFFYSLIVNYSHYSLNENELGHWISNLFHKNDGYQVPIVINPMREEGIIDINNETDLARARLIANLLRPVSGRKANDLTVTNNLVADRLRLNLKPGLADEVVYINRMGVRDSVGEYIKSIDTEVRFSELDIDLDDLLTRVNRSQAFGFKGKFEAGNHVVNLAHRYIVRKLVKIAITYPMYRQYFDREQKAFDAERLNEYLMLLFNKNQNHVSFKLRQTLNFLKYRHITIPRNKRVFYLDLEKFGAKINGMMTKNRAPQDAILEFIPPPIFEMDIIMTPLEGRRKMVRFETLSSGEKQLIFSINSILYHLINLDSIRNSELQWGYKFVNIMLEEVELYFHPDMQREFVDTLLRRINEINYRNIKALNICFVTHSPFILSDIPNANILFLADNGLPKYDAIKDKTFGANIHDLIKHSFFLEKGPMGEFAKNRINDTINFLNYSILSREIEKQPQIQVKKMTEEDKLRARELKELSNKVEEFDRLKHRNRIDQIGEPVLKQKLAEMYDLAFGPPGELQLLQLRIKELQQRASLLKSKE